MIIVNTKNYKFGNSLIKLAIQIQKYFPKAILAVPSTEIRVIANKTKLEVYAQHFESKESNRATGFVLAEAIKSAGAKGSLINHSEHPIKINQIKDSLIISKKLNLKLIICASNLKEAKIISKSNPKPMAIAFEDLKLIATGKSITRYNPKSIINFIKIIKKTKIIPLCGAGISTADDVKTAYKLGCKGVLIASAISNSKNPVPLLKKLRELQ